MAEGTQERPCYKRMPSDVIEDELDFYRATYEKPLEYNMNHERRGVALIINNRHFTNPELPERVWTDIDAKMLTTVLKKYGFSVQRKDNLTAYDMVTFLSDAAKEDHSDSDCFACVILSHGDNRGIYGTDTIVSADYLFASFKGDKCKSLADKPKLFFIQACLGTQKDEGIDVFDNDDVDNGTCETDGSAFSTNHEDIRRIPVEANFLTVFSTLPGQLSWRHPEKGSLFIRKLCRVFDECGFKEEMMAMMTKVNRLMVNNLDAAQPMEAMNRKKRVACVISTLTKALYLHRK